ncbi:hypothetical protein LOAG_01585 [Loa loa]|uniref:Uncharacterized protein n=1 Tax=Loa loa TaxID=7209 RepID=A0A1S0U8I9_LOALO|nr:hypothetical protein LOAG_01585 [Loa loa]EFO26891.1 hypothetical protein LOAG_01585 [Loa loa]
MDALPTVSSFKKTGKNFNHLGNNQLSGEKYLIEGCIKLQTESRLDLRKVEVGLEIEPIWRCNFDSSDDNLRPQFTTFSSLILFSLIEVQQISFQSATQIIYMTLEKASRSCNNLFYHIILITQHIKDLT